MSWEFQDHLPIYAQLMDTLKRRIITGRYLPGEKLPSVRELAAEAGINPNTVQRAFSELEREGLIYTQRATGKYVTENADEIKSARQALAKTQVAEFLSNMQSLGYSVGDVIVLLQSFNESEEESSHADSGM
ncbi:MAG: GntR family transcriptional regulator [Clostridiales bacterium]|jgi:GntR family transcriptional regulator|nr:GntR family transcriptional regulator [Bacillota bacterium]MCI6760076.1 GntR family transcriptional regulator [Clostridiales bacterium]MDY2692010.1 GntR family transcriptional regulator [Oscillospiraceae bacterium]MDD6063236.1 GntR family transcriptional regulator [Clostridiales bacterium]MDD7486599.1 GntR family transcriptional regulator [Clostridiales bacterium]